MDMRNSAILSWPQLSEARMTQRYPPSRPILLFERDLSGKPVGGAMADGHGFFRVTLEYESIP